MKFGRPIEPQTKPPTYTSTVFLSRNDYDYFTRFGKEMVGMSGRKYLVVRFPGAEFKIYQDSEGVDKN